MKTVFGWAYPELDEFMAREMHEDGTYQASHLRAAVEHVTDFRCALDGGAHVGTWSKLMNGLFARVIACEPSADTFEALSFNREHQGWTNVELHHVALGDHLGSITMALEGKGAEMKNTGARFVKPDGGDVRLITIDSLNLESLGLLKLDVEGSEPFALRGAKATIARCHPIVLFEDKFLWRRYGEDREAPHVFLRSLGYRSYLKAGCDQIWGPA